MEPLHVIEYELNSAWANDVGRQLVRWEWRRGGWRDAPQFLAALVLGGLIVWLVIQELILPGVGGALMALLSLLIAGTVLRRWSLARTTAATVLLPLHMNDRRVRIEFREEGLRLETEYYRGEGAWKELEEVLAFSDFRVLYLSNGGRILLPTSSVSPELDAFIHAKAQQVGAMIHSPGFLPRV